MEARGHNGQVHFDGQFVTITRRGFIARATVGKGEKRIPLHNITAVQWKPATHLVNGFIQFTIAGGIERRSRFGRQSADAASDENSVLFMHKQMAAFAQLRAEIEASIARAHAAQAAPPPYAPPRYTPPPPAPGPAQRMRELTEMHGAGLISDQEFHAKRAEILRGL